jgi:hypothetical protein
MVYLKYEGGEKMENKKAQGFDVVGQIIDYESGQLEPAKILELFSELIKTRLVWSLQGSYRRQAQALIEGGYISEQGEILKEIGE